MIITVDGPTGSGKSSVSKLFAKRNNFQHIDTGAMYRALTYVFLENKVAIEDIDKYLQDTNMEIIPEGIYINGLSLTKELRTSEIDENIRNYAHLKNVRKWLVDYQRNMIGKGNYIMDGRDIGTVVFPNAPIKIFLNADVKERARRRVTERDTLTYEDTLDQIIKRDYADSTRKESPLVKANDAIEIDTTELTLEEVVKKIEEIYTCCVKSS